jgi:hypothetical protein
MNCKRVRSFSEVDEFSYTSKLQLAISNEIENSSKDNILNIDENAYIEYLKDQYSFDELVIDQSSEMISKPKISKEQRSRSPFGGSYIAEVYTFTISYSFTGTKGLFSVSPSSMTMTSYIICVDEHSVSFEIELTDLDPQKFQSQKQSAFGNAFSNVDNINNFVKRWNSSLENYIRPVFSKIKDKYIKENDFYAAINLTVNENSKAVFSVPVIAKKIVPKPSVPTKKVFTAEPVFAIGMYKDIIVLLNSIGHSWERKPTMYLGKDEESLRDLFVAFLETRYDGATATGETFNKIGKTDILLKHAKDGSNLFVAECKFWHGQSEFLEAISQLFDRYLTWRDSKTALMMFEKNKEFSTVLATAEKEIEKHPYFLKKIGDNGESSFSYEFHLPGDKAKIVYLEVMFFHFPTI